MPFIWNEKYSVGVKLFDEQHQKYLELANQIDALSMAPIFDKEKILAALDEFVKYAPYHLVSEEKFFEEYKFPERELHIAEHNLYREKIKEFLSKAQNPDADLKQIAKDLSDFAVDWLLRHVTLMDQHYTEFFNEHGVK
ncbi:MAG: bacteriohemerythrin [Patescibacteria group bacterium]